MERNEIIKKIKPILISMVLILAGTGIGWEFSASRYEEQLTELQWQLEMARTETASAAEAEAEAAAASQIAVYVVGCVEKPGVIHLTEGARMYEAVEKAVPLPEANLEILPMARTLSDGETVTVPNINDEEGFQTTYSASTTGLTPDGKININQATAQELADYLPGIGEKLSQRIVTYRETNGKFASTQEICNVSGIGSGIYAQIESLITVK